MEPEKDPKSHKRPLSLIKSVKKIRHKKNDYKQKSLAPGFESGASEQHLHSDPSLLSHHLRTGSASTSLHRLRGLLVRVWVEATENRAWVLGLFSPACSPYSEVIRKDEPSTH